jgi:hypothetical protein
MENPINVLLEADNNSDIIKALKTKPKPKTKTKQDTEEKKPTVKKTTKAKIVEAKIVEAKVEDDKNKSEVEDESEANSDEDEDINNNEDESDKEDEANNTDDDDDKIESKPTKNSKTKKEMQLCAHINTKGKYEGQNCQTSVKDGNTLCKIHMKDEAKKKEKLNDTSNLIVKTGIKCVYIFKKGRKENQVCGNNNAYSFNNLCKTHGGKDNDEEEDAKGCEIILNAGPNKGKPCCKKLHSQSDTLCDYHFKKSNNTTNSETSSITSNSHKTPCIFIVTRGERKGSQCGKPVCLKSETYCATHFKATNPTPKSKKIISTKPVKPKEIKLNDINSNDTDNEEDTKNTNNIDSNTCSYVFSRGKNKGNNCIKKIHDNGSFCKEHSKKQTSSTSSNNSSTEDKITCSYMLTSGKNKGNTCTSKVFEDSNYCKKHTKSDSKSDGKLSEPVKKTVKKINNEIANELAEKSKPPSKKLLNTMLNKSSDCGSDAESNSGSNDELNNLSDDELNIDNNISDDDI